MIFIDLFKEPACGFNDFFSINFLFLVTLSFALILFFLIILDLFCPLYNFQKGKLKRFLKEESRWLKRDYLCSCISGEIWLIITPLILFITNFNILRWLIGYIHFLILISVKLYLSSQFCCYWSIAYWLLSLSSLWWQSRRTIRVMKIYRETHISSRTQNFLLYLKSNLFP